MGEPEFRCGFVAVVGRPNVGKSTLVNALVGRKVSIVTSRPQTTRQRVIGVASTDRAQLLFVDTPGMHRREKHALNKLMNRSAQSSLADADVVLVVVEAGRWTEEDEDVLARAQAAGRPVMLLLNKIDRIRPREAVLPMLQEAAARGEFAAVVPISAERGENLARLRELLEAAVPEGPALFPPDQWSNRDERFHIAEVVREKLMRRLRDELPYGLAVEIERLGESEQGRLEVGAVVWVEREAHKAIVIGKGGEMLKAAGQAARLELKARFERPVHLEIWVKVREHWTDREADLKRLGYDGD
ncbi:GTPase Era [Wenzhouxiangella sp. XN24]|uniref:GTPase Era n=1 Tax=Wenzhouxiangella sp. XN24 TaxID=2713569 RepID=UPI0013ED1CDE|nr:GTPase Era [Wenzhouxiangella sp. XN24]NGX16743.1 GTPase Era [Wenzhouxiangella sp. XN24]